MKYITVITTGTHNVLLINSIHD